MVDLNTNATELSPPPPLREAAGKDTALFLIECADGFLRLVVRVGNVGLGELPPGLSVTVYALDEDTEVALASVQTPEVIESGQTSQGLVIELDPADLPLGSLRVVVDEDGGAGVLDECREDNNEQILEGLCD